MDGTRTAVATASASSGSGRTGSIVADATWGNGGQRRLGRESSHAVVRYNPDGTFESGGVISATVNGLYDGGRDAVVQGNKVVAAGLTGRAVGGAADQLHGAGGTDGFLAPASGTRGALRDFTTGEYRTDL